MLGWWGWRYGVLYFCMHSSACEGWREGCGGGGWRYGVLYFCMHSSACEGWREGWGVEVWCVILLHAFKCL